VEICRWAQILRGTGWAMPSDKLEIYRNYLLQGQNWVSYRGSMDISACGRQLSPSSPRDKARAIARVMECAATFDIPHASEYLAFVSRNSSPSSVNDLIGNRIFWRSDYVIQRQPNFCATLKMHSKRVVGTESLNGENLSGYYLSDGTLYLYGSGDEYQDLFPVWDWRKLPGVTCSQSAEPPPPITAQSLKTDRDFVGGVSDGTIGCAVMDYDRDGVKAHKAWFFGEDFIFCLGSGISSEAEAPLATTINQSLLRGAVVAQSHGKQALLASGESDLHGVDWIEQDGWRYAFPDPASVRLSAASRTGNWSRVFQNASTPAGDVTRKVFTLWLDHGVKPSDASYAYAILPAGRALDAKVIENTDAVQAVSFDDHRAGVIFWKRGKVNIAGIGEIEADQACALLVDSSSGRMFVSDPTQTLASLVLDVEGARKEVQLPSNGDAGRSVEVGLK
jgi:chondroitin AC lyase